MRRKSPSKTAGEALQTRRMSLEIRTWSFARVRVGQRSVEEPRQSCMHGTPVAGDATPKGGAHQGCGASETRMQGEHNPQHKHATWTMLGVWFASSHDFWFKGDLDALG